jgi:uncharacterized protein (DUF2147 family)
MFASIRTFALATAGLVAWSSTSSAAGSDPTGVWFDHNGRGAVEIAPCASGNGLCGYVVHIKEEKNAKRCGMQILGNVTEGGGGWIYSPERGKKYSVELTRLNDEQLRVVGNAGSFFSKTFTWKRAPDDIARCGDGGQSAKVVPPKPVEATRPAAEVAPAHSETVPRADETAYEPAGASSASLALLGAPKLKRVAEAKPVDAVATDAAPVTEEPAPKKAAPAKVTAAAAEGPVEESFEPERKCKYKIPYVGRVISIPCRD